MGSSSVNGNYYSIESEENDRTDWVPLSLTLVEYPKGKKLHSALIILESRCFISLQIFAGDTLGKLLALISLAPFGIGAGFVTLILFRRDLHTVS